MRLVLIEWYDAAGCTTDWAPLSTMPPLLPTNRSVGWLLHDTENCKVVVPHITDELPESGIDRQGCGDMTIPTYAIVRMVDLVEVDAFRTSLIQRLARTFSSKSDEKNENPTKSLQNNHS